MTARQDRVSVPSAVGENRRRIQILEAVAATGGGGGIQFNSGTYGPDNVGDWLMIETDDYANTAFSRTSNVFPGNTEGGGEAHNNKYGALFTKPVDSPFYVWALNVFDDQTDTGSGFAQGIEIVISSDGPSAKGIDMVVDASYGSSGGATGIDMGVESNGTGGCFGMFISVVSETARSKGLDVGYGNTTAGTASQTGIVVGGGGDTSNVTRGIEVSDFNFGTGDSFGVDSVSRASGGGDAVGVSSRARVSGGGAAFSYKGFNDAGSLVFAVDDSGNIHIPAAASVVNDL